MRFTFIVVMLVGCSVFKDARDELNKDITGVQSELARLWDKEKSQ